MNTKKNGRSQRPHGLRHWNGFVLSNTGIVRSNLTQGTDVCLCYVAVLRRADPQPKVSYRLRLTNWSQTSISLMPYASSGSNTNRRKIRRNKPDVYIRLFFNNNGPELEDRTNSMQLSPSWKLIICSATQEFLWILWNLKAHLCFHNSLPLIPIPSQMNPAHTTPSYLSKIHFATIFHRHQSLHTGFYFSSFPTKPCMRSSSPPCVLHALSISLSFN
jgi:hypothetical protein